MSLEDFQLIDNEPIYNSIIKRDFQKVYHQQQADLINFNQHRDFIFGENNNNHQIGDAYLEFDITVRNTAGIFAVTSVTSLVNNAFAYCFKQATFATTSGMDLEDIKHVVQFSTNLLLLTSKGSDLSSCFDKNVGKALDDNNPMKQILINNHAEEVNNGKIKGQHYNIYLDFVKLLKK